jgi:parallel beta-helix repeat protein
LTGGRLTITNSTISGNRAAGKGGGLDIYQGDLVMTNSTISGNRAGDDGGGMYLSYDDNVNVINSTITGNTAAGSGGSVSMSGYITLSCTLDLRQHRRAGRRS